MILLRIGYRESLRQPGRSILTILSIVIGVATVVAVAIASGTTQQAFDNLYQTVAGHADLEITAAGGGSFDQAVADVIAKIPGVKTAAPIIQRPIVMYFQHKRVKLYSLGVDPDRDQDIHDYVVTEGKSLTEGKGILLDAAFAKSMGIRPSDQIKLLTRRGLIKAQVAGLFSSRGTAVTGQGAVMFMQLRAAQYASKMPDKVGSIQVVIAPEASEASVKDEIIKRLPEGLVVGRPVARSDVAQAAAVSTNQGLNMARSFSLLVATFIITNTFLISVTQRRRQIGIMRAIGATRTQIAKLLYGEALMMGVLGTCLGWTVGVVCAHYLTRAMGMLYDTVPPAIEITPLSFLLAVVFGLGISLIAAWMPARRASRLQPIEAMRETLTTEIEGVSGWLTGFGVLQVLVSGTVLAASILGWIPMFFAVWSAVLLLAGFVLLLPVVIGRLMSLIVIALRPLIPVEARLAQRQLLRHRARTTLTIGVLFVAISTGIGLASSVIDNVDNVRSWYSRTIVADFFVRALSPDMATGQAADLPDAIGNEIRRAAGVTSVETVRFVSGKSDEHSVIIVVRDYGADHEPAFDLVSGETQGLCEQLEKGDVVVGSVLAQRAGLRLGDRIPLETDAGTKPLRVAGIANDYLSGGLTIHMQRDVAERLLHVTGVDAYIINADHAQLAGVRDQLQRLADQYGLLLQSFSDIQQHIDQMMSGVVSGLWGLVVLGFVVAAFGVANTLTMNVLEQTRELGLLRIVGATRWQLRRTILAQPSSWGCWHCCREPWREL